MQDSLCQTTLWKTNNIIYGTWNSICSTNKVSHIKMGDTPSYNDIQRRVSAGNKKWKQK